MKAKKPPKDQFSEANGEGYPAEGKERSTTELYAKVNGKMNITNVMKKQHKGMWLKNVC